MPALFPALRVLADRPRTKARFLLLGSASPALVKKASESLACRVEFVEMGGFDVEETGADSWRELSARGGFPRAYLAGSDQDSAAWREGFVKTFLERDIPSLGITIPPAALRRFWTMLAHYHGQTWNASELARAMGIADMTVRSYLDILTGAYMVRQLQPWHENLSKRHVKAPKIYLRDSGLLHSLLGVPEAAGLLGHPKVGASFEGFIVEQVARLLHPPELYFWGAHKIAAFMAWEPYPSLAVTNDAGRVLSYSQDIWPDHPCCVLAVSTAFLEKHTAEVNALRRAHRKSIDYIVYNSGEAVSIGVKYTAMDPAVVTLALGHIQCDEKLSSSRVLDYALTLNKLGYTGIGDPPSFLQSLLHTSP